MEADLKSITKEQIEGFVYQLIKTNNISETYQNQLINSIKAYYEHVLGKPREYHDIKRPKKRISIPNVLTEAEVRNILNSPENLKHKAILWTIYSAGLGIPELSNLRIRDIHPDEGCIFIKGAKGKKDRKTILSEHLLPLSRSYYKACKPSCWLFEGQTGGRYSATSIRAIFREAVKATNANPWATVHAPGHSFATRCMQNNVNPRHVQAMPGHSSPKTTELYTKIIEINKKKTTSPLDKMLENTKLYSK